MSKVINKTLGDGEEMFLFYFLSWPVEYKVPETIYILFIVVSPISYHRN